MWLKNINRVYLLAIFKISIQPWPPLFSRPLFGSSAFATSCCLLQIPGSLITWTGISYSYLQVAVQSSLENIRVFYLRIFLFSPRGQNLGKGTLAKISKWNIRRSQHTVQDQEMRKLLLLFLNSASWNTQDWQVQHPFYLDWLPYRRTGNCLHFPH